VIILAVTINVFVAKDSDDSETAPNNSQDTDKSACVVLFPKGADSDDGETKADSDDGETKADSDGGGTKPVIVCFDDK